MSFKRVIAGSSQNLTRIPMGYRNLLHKKRRNHRSNLITLTKNYHGMPPNAKGSSLFPILQTRRRIIDNRAAGNGEAGLTPEEILSKDPKVKNGQFLKGGMTSLCKEIKKKIGYHSKRSEAIFNKVMNRPFTQAMSVGNKCYDPVMRGTVDSKDGTNSLLSIIADNGIKISGSTRKCLTDSVLQLLSKDTVIITHRARRYVDNGTKYTVLNDEDWDYYSQFDTLVLEDRTDDSDEDEERVVKYSSVKSNAKIEFIWEDIPREYTQSEFRKIASLYYPCLKGKERLHNAKRGIYMTTKIGQCLFQAAEEAAKAVMTGWQQDILSCGGLAREQKVMGMVNTVANVFHALKALIDGDATQFNECISVEVMIEALSVFICDWEKGNIIYAMSGCRAALTKYVGLAHWPSKCRNGRIVKKYFHDMKWEGLTERWRELFKNEQELLDLQEESKANFDRFGISMISVPSAMLMGMLGTCSTLVACSIIKWCENTRWGSLHGQACSDDKLLLLGSSSKKNLQKIHSFHASVEFIFGINQNRAKTLAYLNTQENRACFEVTSNYFMGDKIPMPCKVSSGLKLGPGSIASNVSNFSALPMLVSEEGGIWAGMTAAIIGADLLNYCLKLKGDDLGGDNLNRTQRFIRKMGMEGKTLYQRMEKPFSLFGGKINPHAIEVAFGRCTRENWEKACYQEVEGDTGKTFVDNQSGRPVAWEENHLTGIWNSLPVSGRVFDSNRPAFIDNVKAEGEVILGIMSRINIASMIGLAHNNQKAKSYMAGMISRDLFMVGDSVERERLRGMLEMKMKTHTESTIDSFSSL